MSRNYFDELRETYGSEKWFINVENREKTKTEEQRELDYQFWKACFGGDSERAVDLFKKGATNDYQFNGDSALHLVCNKGHQNIAEDIIRLFPEEIERKTMIGKGFRTPIGYAFKGGKTEVGKWLIQMGAQNPIHNAIWCGKDYEAIFKIIEETGKSLEYIIEDLPRLKNLNLLTQKWTLDGIKELLNFYENDEKIFQTIIFILASLELDNYNLLVLD